MQITRLHRLIRADLTESRICLLYIPEHILEMFHGKPYTSLCDAAGGNYQFAIAAEDRPKTGFILPTACGGTIFLWKVAPYEIANMPAIYSRAMMHVLQGLQEVPLGYANRQDGTADPSRKSNRRTRFTRSISTISDWYLQETVNLNIYSSWCAL